MNRNLQNQINKKDLPILEENYSIRLHNFGGSKPWGVFKKGERKNHNEIFLEMFRTKIEAILYVEKYF